MNYENQKENAVKLQRKIVGNVGLAFVVVLIVVCLFCLPQLVDTVEKGTYQVKQSAIFGKMSAKMTPGVWFQGFGDIEVFPNQETFFFTADKDTKDDVHDDLSIEVRFVDGSMCRISGTCRITMPRTASDGVALVVDDGYKTYKDVESKLILPTLRNVLRHTANMMTARESYAEKRQEFVTWSRDQLENGLYMTKTEERKVKDPVSGEIITKTFKIIDRKDGIPTYETHSLIRGIRVANFEIKRFGYDAKVVKQITTQQEALMAVATSKAQAKKAEQEKLREKAVGEQNVMKAKYEEEQKKVRAVVQAQQQKEVALVAAERKKEQATIEKEQALIEGTKRKEVAVLDRDAAKMEKERQILLGEGEAKRKKLVMIADGALQQKLSTIENIHNVWAQAFANRNVPQVVMGGGNDTDKSTMNFQDAISLMGLKQIGLDLSVPKN